MLDAWLAERADLSPRTRAEYRRAVERFEAWLPTANLPGSIETTDRKAAGQYKSALVKKETHYRTANKDLSALSVYWKWLRTMGYCSDNVWKEQSLPKRLAKVAESANKRPFNDAEMTALFSVAPADDPELRDAMYIAASSAN